MTSASLDWNPVSYSHFLTLLSFTAVNVWRDGIGCVVVGVVTSRGAYLVIEAVQ